MPEIAELALDCTDVRLLVNPTGRFVVGGPMGDAGLTGRKIIVDTYGGFARHGGGAFSGKDPSKVDRSAAYAMRWVAKNAVAAGLADRIEVQVAYAIGKAAPVGLFVETFGTERVDPLRIQNAITEVFDLRPAAIIRDLDLLRPIYAPTAAYGHFGRTDLDLPWERTDRAEALRSAATPDSAVSFTTGSFTTGGPSRGGVTVSRAADPPDLPGPPTLRFVAPGSVTAGRYGLFEYAMGPRSPGPGPHFHRTFSESFYVLSGELTIFADDSWTTFGPGDFAHVRGERRARLPQRRRRARRRSSSCSPRVSPVSGSSPSWRRCARRVWSSPPRSGSRSTPATTR